MTKLTIKNLIKETGSPKKHSLTPGKKYILHGWYDNVSLPITLKQDIWYFQGRDPVIQKDWEFETDYSLGNRDEWVKKFIGTEFEGLVYDPKVSYFSFSDIDRVEGKRIYLKPTAR